MIKKVDFSGDIVWAVKKWMTRTDGYGGAIGGIIGEIPWGNDISEIVEWDDVCDKFSKVIPDCPHYDVWMYVRDSKIRSIVDKKSMKIAKDIVRVYFEIIDGVNKFMEKANG